MASGAPTLAYYSTVTGTRTPPGQAFDAAYFGHNVRDTVQFAPAIEAMIDHDLVFDALLLPKHLPVLQDFAGLYPELRLVVDHGAKPQLRTGDIAEWRHEITAIARSTNAVCKLSGLVTEAGSANPALLAPCVDHLLEAFGPNRLMWGSDWPVCRLAAEYGQVKAALEEALGPIGDYNRSRILGETAIAFYGLD